MVPSAVGRELNLHVVKDERELVTKRESRIRQTAWEWHGVYRHRSSKTRALDRWIGDLSGALPPEPKSLITADDPSTGPSSIDEQRNALNELIITLIRK
jgi:hypothetical protein